MTSDEQVPQETSLGQYAGVVTRLIAWIIDRLILVSTISISAVAISYLAQAFNINELLGFSDALEIIVRIAVLVMAIALPIVYNIGFWMLAGQTIGKRMMGLRVVRTNGQRVTFWAAVRRQIGYAISAILFLGYLWILFDNRRQGFHDKLAGTYVVYAWPEPVAAQRPIQDRLRRIRLERKMAQSSEGQEAQ